MTNAAPLPGALAALDEAPFFQAGLQGYSDGPMRILARRLGAPYCVTESLLDETLSRGGKGLQSAELDAEDHPIAGQIIGTCPETMARAAEILLELGHDAIDVNLACPVKKMRGLCRGGHLLTRPDVAREILTAVRDAVGGRVPVTVKLRRGFDEESASRTRFFEVLESVVELGFAAATVHGRTVEQKYEGLSSWTFLEEVTQRFPDLPVFGSGDIYEAQDIFRRIRESGVRGVSVARGAIGNPWIFRQAREIQRGEPPSLPTVADQRRVIEEHFELSVRFLGESAAGRMLRKLGIRFSRHHPRQPEVWQAFVDMKTTQDLARIFERYYADGEEAAAGSQRLRDLTG